MVKIIIFLLNSEVCKRLKLADTLVFKCYTSELYSDVLIRHWYKVLSVLLTMRLSLLP